MHYWMTGMHKKKGASEGVGATEWPNVAQRVDCSYSCSVFLKKKKKHVLFKKKKFFFKNKKHRLKKTNSFFQNKKHRLKKKKVFFFNTSYRDLRQLQHELSATHVRCVHTGTTTGKFEAWCQVSCYRKQLDSMRPVIILLAICQGLLQCERTFRLLHNNRLGQNGGSTVNEYYCHIRSNTTVSITHC